MKNIYPIVEDLTQYITSQEICRRKQVGRCVVNDYAKRFGWKKYVYRRMLAFERNVVEEYLKNGPNKKRYIGEQDMLPDGYITWNEMVRVLGSGSYISPEWERKYVKRERMMGGGFLCLRRVSIYSVRDILKGESSLAKSLTIMDDKFWKKERLEEWSPANNKNNDK